MPAKSENQQQAAGIAVISAYSTTGITIIDGGNYDGFHWFAIGY